MQDDVITPFISTVQTPQTPTLQASFVPVNPRSYLIMSTKVRRAGTSAEYC
jgi:hypothetical protein